MVQWHTKSDKLPSGGKRHTKDGVSKKNAWKGGREANTKAQSDAKDDKIVTNGRGNTSKVKSISTAVANLCDKETKKITKVEIINVKENTANRLYARSNIATKGAIIRVRVSGAEKEARVTNRPGQDGVINAILI